MIILPSSYLPSVGYLLAMLSSPTTIDLGEHYIKRSARNRARIMTGQGVMELTVPVKRANRPRSPMVTMEIDNSKRWQHQHWIAITSAYRSSPYFEHYAPYLEPIFQREWSSLVDLNREILSVIIKLLRCRDMVAPIYSNSYISPSEGDVDLRAKGAFESFNGDAVAAMEYIQVFHDREPFVANLSVLDLLFCEGSGSSAILSQML